MAEYVVHILILSLVTVASSQECGVSRNATRYIFGGDPSATLEFPWQISLQKFVRGVWRHTCGGSIIDESRILTAAHCVDSASRTPVQLRVVTGEHDLTKNEGTEDYFLVDRERGDITIHSGWDNNTVDYDYALIHLDRPLNFTGAHSHLAPVCLPTPTDTTRFDNMTCIGSGWGLAKEDDLNSSGNKVHMPAILQKMKFKVPTHDECSKAWLSTEGESMHLTPRHICAATMQGEGHGVCFGDSGGPLQCSTDEKRWTLAGVASFVQYCGSEAYPNVYARTSAVLDWIKEEHRVPTRDSH